MFLNTLDTVTRSPAYPRQFCENLTYDTGAPSTTIAATFPLATTSGRLLISYLTNDKSSGTVTAPAGWTLAYSTVGASVSSHIAWKVSDGTETTVTWSWATAQAGGTMLAMEMPSYVGTTHIETVNPTYSDTAVSTVTTTATVLSQNAYAFGLGATDSERFVTYPRWDFSHINERFGALSGEPWTQLVGQKFLNGETPSVTWTLTVADQAYASIIVFNEATGGASQTVNPTGVADSSAVGSPSVSSIISISPTGISTAESIGQPSITTTIGVSPTGVSTGESTGSPSVTATISVSPTGIADASSVGTPSVTGGSVPGVTLAPDGIGDTSALGSPALSAVVTLAPTGVGTAESVGTPSITLGTLILEPTGIGSIGSIGQPALSATITLAPVGIGASQLIGSPTITVITQTVVYPNGIGYPTATTSKKLIFLFDD